MHNVTNTKLNSRFRCLLRHWARKWSESILHPWTHTGAIWKKTSCQSAATSEIAKFQGIRCKL